MATVVKPEPIDMDGEQQLQPVVAREQPPRSDQQPMTTGNQVNDDKQQLQMMQTDEEDPLLQETIHALLTGGASSGPVGADEATDNERNYECNFCGKLFTRSNTLSYHLKVHNDEKPYKCGSCDKAFREQYRLTKHQRTHSRRDFPGQQDQDADQSQDSNFPSIPGRTGEDEDYTTGDSERFFRNYALQEETAVMKLEPDISLTVDSGSTTTGTQSSNSDSDVRYQIIEERIKSLQREVHLVNQNLNRVETKLDGLTKIMAIFINKFDEIETQPNVANNSNAMIPIPMISLPLENIQGLHQPTPQPTVSVNLPPQQQSQPSPVVAAPPPPTPIQQPIQMIATHHPVTVATVTTVQPPPQQPQHPQQQFIGNLHAVVAPAPATNNHNSPPVQQMTTLVQSNHNHNNNDTFPEVPDLPIRTVSDFLDLNDHCTDNEQFLLQMMIRLHQEVDNSQPHQRNIKKMMEALVTYEVLCQFSWSGKSAINGQYTKYVFGNSVGIIDLLTKTLNLGKSAEEAEANQKPIFTAIQSFIKHSRQNMLRDSRKRRDSNNGLGHAGGGYNKWDMGGAIHCGADRQLKPSVATTSAATPQQQIKLEKQDLIGGGQQQFYE